MKKNKLLVEKAMKADYKTLRDMTAYLSGYLEKSNPEISDLLKTMLDESFKYDLKHEDKIRDRTINIVLNTVK